MLGLLLTDMNFILVANFPTLFPGNYWFLVIGPIFEGCLGGAYLSFSIIVVADPFHIQGSPLQSLLLILILVIRQMNRIG